MQIFWGADSESNVIYYLQFVVLLKMFTKPLFFGIWNLLSFYFTSFYFIKNLYDLVFIYACMVCKCNKSNLPSIFPLVFGKRHSKFIYKICTVAALMIRRPNENWMHNQCHKNCCLSLLNIM